MGHPKMILEKKNGGGWKEDGIGKEGVWVELHGMSGGRPLESREQAEQFPGSQQFILQNEYMISHKQ